MLKHGALSRAANATADKIASCAPPTCLSLDSSAGEFLQSLYQGVSIVFPPCIDLSPAASIRREDSLVSPGDFLAALSLSYGMSVAALRIAKRQEISKKIIDSVSSFGIGPVVNSLPAALRELG